MSALLTLIPSKVWLYGALAVAMIIGIKVHDNKLLREGIAEQQAADAKAAATLAQQTAKETADLKARADMAQKAFEHEQFDNQNFRDTHPLQPVRLCLSASHNSSGLVSQTGAKDTGNGAAGSSPSGVQQVPPGDSGGGSRGAGPDISKLLDALAASADQVSSILREYQSRGQ